MRSRNRQSELFYHIESDNAYIDRVNRTLQPYQRISKVTILDEPLEMTTTKKVKRNYSK